MQGSSVWKTDHSGVGRPVTVIMPNNVTTTLSYDDAGHLLSLTHQM